MQSPAIDESGPSSHGVSATRRMALPPLRLIPAELLEQRTKNRPVNILPKSAATAAAIIRPSSKPDENHTITSAPSQSTHPYLHRGQLELPSTAKKMDTLIAHIQRLEKQNAEQQTQLKQLTETVEKLTHQPHGLELAKTLADQAAMDGAVATSSGQDGSSSVRSDGSSSRLNSVVRLAPKQFAGLTGSPSTLINNRSASFQLNLNSPQFSTSQSSPSLHQRSPSQSAAPVTPHQIALESAKARGELLRRYGEMYEPEALYELDVEDESELEDEATARQRRPIQRKTLQSTLPAYESTTPKRRVLGPLPPPSSRLTQPIGSFRHHTGQEAAAVSPIATQATPHPRPKTAHTPQSTTKVNPSVAVPSPASLKTTILKTPRTAATPLRAPRSTSSTKKKKKKSATKAKYAVSGDSLNTPSAGSKKKSITIPRPSFDSDPTTHSRSSSSHMNGHDDDWYPVVNSPSLTSRGFPSKEAIMNHHTPNALARRKRKSIKKLATIATSNTMPPPSSSTKSSDPLRLSHCSPIQKSRPSTAAVTPKLQGWMSHTESSQHHRTISKDAKKSPRSTKSSSSPSVFTSAYDRAQAYIQPSDALVHDPIIASPLKPKKKISPRKITPLKKITTPRQQSLPNLSLQSQTRPSPILINSSSNPVLTASTTLAPIITTARTTRMVNVAALKRSGTQHQLSPHLNRLAALPVSKTRLCCITGCQQHKLKGSEYQYCYEHEAQLDANPNARQKKIIAVEEEESRKRRNKMKRSSL